MADLPTPHAGGDCINNQSPSFCHDLSPLLIQILSFYGADSNNTNSKVNRPQPEMIIEKSPDEAICFRLLQLDDYHKGYLTLLSQLTKVGEPTFQQFTAQFNRITKSNSHALSHVIIVGEYLPAQTIIATGTLLVEAKFIRNLGFVGHIEDIVVHNQYRHQGYGLSVVKALTRLSEDLGCYKTILDCSEDKQPFYTLAQYESHSVQMSKYR